MRLLYDELIESNQDVRIYCPTLREEYYDYYVAPWFALNPLWANEHFWFIEELGDEELRQSTMLEF